MKLRPCALPAAPDQVRSARHLTRRAAFLPGALAITADTSTLGGGVAPSLALAHSAKPVTPRDRLLRLAEVEALTGLRKSCLYRLMSEGKFPASVRLTARSVAWSEAACMAWIQARIQEGANK